MKYEKTKNATRNIFFGVLLKLYRLLVPFFMRTIFIYSIGIEYLGLNGLFVSILSVLNLAELGVGSAMVYSMYKPVAEDDSEKICALMYLYRLYYRIIGVIILITGLLLIPVLPYLVSRDMPEGINLTLLYIMNLGTTVLSYWLFAYKNAILNANQRTDIVSKVTLITNTIQYILQFVAIVVFKNYYLYLMIALITQMVTNIMIAVFATKMYPHYKPQGKLDIEERRMINKRIADLFTSKIGGVVITYADTIVISAFLGLTILAVYQNYFYIMNSIIGVVAAIFASCTAGIGNSLLYDSLEKIYKDFLKFSMIIAWLAGMCSVCLLCLYQPFMEIWMGKELMLDILCVICFCIYFFIYELNSLFSVYKDAGGIWHEDRYRPLVTAIVNLSLNICLVNIIEIKGVLLSTVLSSLFIGMPWIVHNIFKMIFKRSAKQYILKLIIYSFLVIIACIISFGACSLVTLSGIIELGVKLFICLTISSMVFWIGCHKMEEYELTKNMVIRILKRR